MFIVLRLSFALVHAITAYKGSGSVAPIIHRREWPASRSCRFPGSFLQNVGLAAVLVWKFGRRERSTALQEFEPRAFRLIDYTTTTTYILLAKLKNFLFEYKFRGFDGAQLSFDSLLSG